MGLVASALVVTQLQHSPFRPPMGTMPPVPAASLHAHILLPAVPLVSCSQAAPCLCTEPCGHLSLFSLCPPPPPLGCTESGRGCRPKYRLLMANGSAFQAGPTAPRPLKSSDGHRALLLPAVTRPQRGCICSSSAPSAPMGSPHPVLPCSALRGNAGVCISAWFL